MVVVLRLREDLVWRGEIRRKGQPRSKAGLDSSHARKLTSLLSNAGIFSPLPPFPPPCAFASAFRSLTTYLPPKAPPRRPAGAARRIICSRRSTPPRTALTARWGGRGWRASATRTGP